MSEGDALVLMLVILAFLTVLLNSFGDDPPAR